MSDGRVAKAEALAKRLLSYGDVGVTAANKVAREMLTPAVDNRPIVAVLVPCYKNMHPRMQMTFNEMVAFTQKSGVAKLFVPPSMQASVVHWIRNGLIAELIKSKKPFSHVLFLDDDICPGPNYLVQMLSHQKDIVAALCTRRQDPPIPNARVYDESKDLYQELWSWPEGLVKLPGAIGTGMMLISREALQKIADAYFDCVYEKKVFGISDEKAAEWTKKRVADFDENANAWWFRFLPRECGFGEYGEDISFCHIARMIGLDIYMDTTLQPFHMGDYGFSVPDFETHREEAIAKAKNGGRYMEPPTLLAEKVPDTNILVVEG